MQIDPEYEGLIREDATALLRPKTALKDMFLEVEPGGGKPLGEGGTLRLANTDPDVNPDEILAMLDARHARLPHAARDRCRAWPRAAAARTCARSIACSSRPTATSRA